MGGSKTNRPSWRPQHPNPTNIYAKKIQKNGRRQVRAWRQEDPTEENPPEENSVEEDPPEEN